MSTPPLAWKRDGGMDETVFQHTATGGGGRPEAVHLGPVLGPRAGISGATRTGSVERDVLEHLVIDKTRMINMTQQRNIGNIGLLDLRTATEESISGISGIRNVGLMLASESTRALIARLSTANVGALAIAPAEAALINGRVTFTSEYPGTRQEPLSLIINGRLLVKADVSAQAIEEGVKTLIINGDVICPRELESVVQSKVGWINGRTLTYESNDLLVPDRLVLDRAYLESLYDGSRLVVVGGLDVPEVLSNELLERKVASIAVGRSARFHQENADLLRPRIVDLTGRLRFRVIPEGYRLVDKRLDIGNAMLRTLDSAKLYVAGRVVIERDTDPALLDSGLSALMTDDLLICPVGLQDVIASKCDLLQTRSVFYEGELWLVEDDQELAPSRFEYTEGTITLLVLGDLAISPDVEPQMLADRLRKVHNIGDIYCSPEQMGALQARIGISEGDFGDIDAQRGSDSSNFGYLAL